MWKWDVYCVCGRDEGFVQERVIEKKKKIKKKEMKGAEMVVVPSITVVGERSWIGGLIRD